MSSDIVVGSIRDLDKVNDYTLKAEEVKAHVELLHRVMKEIMKDGVHYGTIPGCKKPCLYKAGAELLCTTFRLGPRYEMVQGECGDKYARYICKCDIHYIPTGNHVAGGIGSCNSGEKRFRSQTPQECDNNCLKMAQKRALVSAVLNGTSASDIFTCDMEDNVDVTSTNTQRNSSDSSANSANSSSCDIDHNSLVANCKTLEELNACWAKNKGPVYLYSRRKQELEKSCPT